jgi:hypothetical protein
MIRWLWENVRSLFRRERGESETDENRFVPSPLDRSVRSSHGGSDAEIERELHSVSERAREIDEQRRDE